MNCNWKQRKTKREHRRQLVSLVYHSQLHTAISVKGRKDTEVRTSIHDYDNIYSGTTVLKIHARIFWEKVCIGVYMYAYSKPWTVIKTLPSSFSLLIALRTREDSSAERNFPLYRPKGVNLEHSTQFPLKIHHAKYNPACHSCTPDHNI